jgi:hypothetical protein
MLDTENVITDEDEAFLKQHGVPVDEARRQWTILTRRPQRIALDRPCTIGDGIDQLASSQHHVLLETHRESAAQGRWLKFVPASGAASRMFALVSDDQKRQFCESFDQFAFAHLVRQRLSDQGVVLDELRQAGRCDELINAVVSEGGVGYGHRAKGLVEFHAYPGATRTPFEEHLLEAIACFGARDGTTKCHFTVAAEQRDEFAGHFRQFKSRWRGNSHEVGFSVQHPSTDTIAMADPVGLARGEDGKPVLRPGGHGALIENLNRLQGDLIFVKNVDNVGHEHTRRASIVWTQLLGGYLVRLQGAIHQHLRSLRIGDNQSIAAACNFIRLTFPCAALPDTDDLQATHARLIHWLRRPLRICGMVRNEGEPGGGPFWVREADGKVSLQIVEAAEIDTQDERQWSILQQATHFNPVFMALSVRDEFGEPFDLRNFVDPDRAIITQKPLAGHVATVLERPGLWNGAMAGWNSVFVEVPIDVFSPVKTVLDLLRPEHQPLETARTAGRDGANETHNNT